MIGRKTVICGAICLGVISLAAADPPIDKDAKFSTSAEHQAESRERKIQAEIRELGEHPWAGDYYHGDGMGVNVSLALAPRSGFVFEWHGCLGLYDRNYGSVSSANNKLALLFTFPNERKGFTGIASELVPIPWGPRHYLIPPQQMAEFCNDVNADYEPRSDSWGMYLLRQGDEEKPVRGGPSIPAQFQPELLKHPIVTEITTVGKPKLAPSHADWKFKKTPVTVKGGADIGLHRRMKLYVTEPQTVFASIEVGTVHEHASEGVMTGISKESADPEVGWKVSTRWREASPDAAKKPAKR
jgi:hypothetical protein